MALSVNAWTVLGIAPTTDIRTILRAYAEKLRVTRPEDDSGGFQRLMEAREQALAWRPTPTISADEADGDTESPPLAEDEIAASGAPFDIAARASPPPRWRAPTTSFESPERPVGPPPRWRAPLPPPSRPDKVIAPPPAPEKVNATPPDRALGSHSYHGVLASFRASLARLAHQPEAVFRDLAAWQDIFALADLLSLAERESARAELAAMLIERLPDVSPNAPSFGVGLVAVIERLDRDFDLARVANDVKRFGDGPQRTRLADWLNGCAAERTLRARREGGRPAYRLPSGLPLIPPGDRLAALGRSDLIAIYDGWTRGEPTNWGLAWRGAGWALLLPGGLAAARDAARLTLIAAVLEIAAFALTIVSASHFSRDGADAIGRIENAAAVAILVLARIAVISLWPRFAVARAAARVWRADLSGLSTPVGRRPTLSRRFSGRAFFALAAFLAGAVDVITSLGVAGTFLAAFDLAK